MSTSRKYDAMHLSSNRNYQLQQTNWYEIAIGGMSQDITFIVQSCTLPEVSNPAIDVGFGNSTAKIAGKREYGSGSFVFMDAIMVDIEQQLLDWQRTVQDERTGKMGWVDDYKRDMTVTQYGPDGTYERKWSFEGAWPSSINYGEMSGESSDKKTISVTIEYDKATRE